MKQATPKSVRPPAVDYIQRLEQFVLENQHWDEDLTGCRDCGSVNELHVDGCLVAEVRTRRAAEKNARRQDV